MCKTLIGDSSLLIKLCQPTLPINPILSSSCQLYISRVSHVVLVKCICMHACLLSCSSEKPNPNLPTGLMFVNVSPLFFFFPPIVANPSFCDSPFFANPKFVQENTSQKDIEKKNAFSLPSSHHHLHLTLPNPIIYRKKNIYI